MDSEQFHPEISESNQEIENEEENTMADRFSESNPGNIPPQKGGGKHLRGWQWRESTRATDKKNRAKNRHFGLDRSEQIEFNQDFIVERETDGQYATVVEVTNGIVKVFYKGDFLKCPLKSDLPFNMINGLAVGDSVTLDHDDHDQPVIDHLIKRTTVLSRLRRDNTRRSGEGNEQVIAANIDEAVIVVSTQAPPLHPRFIDRYLVLIEHARIKPIICLNKCDLSTNDETLAPYRALGLQIIQTSTTLNYGIDDLKDSLAGKTVVLVGQSGVGKSSLINAIYPDARLRTSTVSEKSGRGRHTTTSSSLYTWGQSSRIIDTPGIRALEIWDIPKEDLQLYFDEIFEYSKGCKYNNCLHQQERFEDCAVKKSVDEDLISRARYDSYLRVLAEL